MNNCEHEIQTEYKEVAGRGAIISMCSKCGEILSIKPVPKDENTVYDEQTKNSNGGQILYD